MRTLTVRVLATVLFSFIAGEPFAVAQQPPPPAGGEGEAAPPPAIPAPPSLPGEDLAAAVSKAAERPSP